MGKNFRSPSQATNTSVSSFSDLSRRAKFQEQSKKNYRAFKRFVYDKEKQTFCRKTCKHWFLLIFFYILFMAILLGIFFGIIILIVYYIKATRSEPLFNKTALVPALAFIPRLACKATALVWYSRKASAQSSKSNTHPSGYIKAIDEFLKPYENSNKSLYVNCDETKPGKDQYCRFTKEELGPCGKQGYGYEVNKPCIYLKLNKLTGWVPQWDEAAEHDELHKKISILCSGITSFDVDHMGELSFYPGPFFKDYFFPYDGTPEYRLPLIGIQFKNLNRGFVVGVKCSVDKGVTNMQDENLHTATAFLYIDTD